jgi:hypothetical protein
VANDTFVFVGFYCDEFNIYSTGQKYVDSCEKTLIFCFIERNTAIIHELIFFIFIKLEDVTTRYRTSIELTILFTNCYISVQSLKLLVISVFRSIAFCSYYISDASGHTFYQCL